MATNVVRLVGEGNMCRYFVQETCFVASISDSLLREAILHEMAADDVLEFLLRPLISGLSLHLKQDFQCNRQMKDQLNERMNLLKRPDCFGGCLDFQRLMICAVQPYGEQGYPHIKSCQFCRKAIDDLRSQLPYYPAFNLLPKPENADHS